MGVLAWLKRTANAALGPLNVKIESLTAERAELSRLQKLANNGHFDFEVMPILTQVAQCDAKRVLDQVGRDASEFSASVSAPSTAFQLENDYFTSPDAEVLIAMVRLYRPAKVVEVGSGNSTKLFRVAINNAQLRTHITAIDPHPRIGIANHADVIIADAVEHVRDFSVFERLAENDILFIDSSHEIRPGNDLLFLVFNILPRLAPGVLIHFHDIFLPYEYPKQWVIEHRWSWSEQYLLNAFLMHNAQYAVIWPGYYLQRTRSGFHNSFPDMKADALAKSFWIRKIASPS